MLTEILKNPDLKKYLTKIEAGQILFLEGDHSQDLYILVSGRLNVLKGNTKISEITEPGTLFGEMSFLLDEKRTASVKAEEDTEALRIPKEKITSFFSEFPDAGWEIAKLLARRLDETSQVVYGLKEFCNQLPDAVILTDKEGRILSSNAAAEKLYGRDWHQMHHHRVDEIYEDPEDYRDFLTEVQQRYSIREKILRIRHPELGTRYISTSTTILYDGHHNFQGVLSLGRDVTAVKSLETKYRRFRSWFLPSVILLALLAAGFFFGYPYFYKTHHTVDVRKRTLRDQLAKDYLLLRSLIVDPFKAGDVRRTTQAMAQFFNIQADTTTPITGLILLNREKKVFSAYSIKAESGAPKMLGASYAGIDFQGDTDSIHRVLTVYRADKAHPMGHKGLELAFQISEGNRLLGWLVFQMDGAKLRREYNVDERDLKTFRFKSP